MQRVVGSLLLVLLTAANAAAQSTVFVVRHAERADAGTAAAKMTGADPDLSAAGHTRAASLAAALKDARLTAIFTSEYKRTHQTAEPLAKAAGLSLTQVPSKDVKTLVDKVSSAAGTVLVVGHSNTIPELLNGLGVPDTITIGESDFDNLFIVVLGAKPALIRLHFR